MAKPRTLYDKIWDDHMVDEQPDGTCLLYIDRHLVHEVTSPQAFEGLRTSGRKVRAPEKTLAVVDHNIPTSDRNLPNPDPESAEQIRVMAENARDFGIEYFGERDRRQGIVHVIGPGAGLHLARHHDRVRRQPYLDAWCVRRARARHRHVGSRACARDADADPAQGEEHARGGRRQAAGWRHRQGHHPVDHRRDRHRGRHRLRAGICRRGDPRALGGRPHDGLQHVDRGRRARRHDRAGREDLRIPQGPPQVAEGRRVGNRDALLGDAAFGRGRGVRPRDQARCREAPADRHLGYEPRAGGLDHRPRAAARRGDRRAQARDAARARSPTWTSRAARRSPTSSSTACSSAHAPTAASRICAKSRGSPKARRSTRASTR